MTADLGTSTIIATTSDTMTVADIDGTIAVLCVRGSRWSLTPGQIAQRQSLTEGTALLRLEQIANDFARLFDIPPILAIMPDHAAAYVAEVGIAEAWRWRMKALEPFGIGPSASTLSIHAERAGFPLTRNGIGEFLGAY